MINPLVADPNQTPDPFQGMDPSIINFPNKTNPLNNSLEPSLDMAPDKAADILKLSDKFQKPPDFVEANYAAAKTAAAAPSPQIFDDIVKKYPFTAEFLSTPKNMAVAKDDTASLTKTEQLTQDYGTARTMYNSLQVGMARTLEQVSRIPATVYDLVHFPQNYLAQKLGRSDLEVSAPDWLANNPIAKFYSESAKAWTPPALEQSVTDQIKAGNIGAASKAMAAQLMESAPSLALLIATGAAGYEGAGLAGIGLTSTADAEHRNLQNGVDPATATLNAAYHGAINTAFMNLGALSPLHKWEAAIAESVGQDSARQVVLDVAKTLAGSFSSMGGSMAAISAASDVADYATATNPNALQGSWKRALDAAIVGGFTGAAIPLLTSALGGVTRADDVHRTQQAKDFYLALGDAAKASKLRERLPDAHRELLDRLTKDGPVENVYIPAERFDQYFQEKRMSPDRVASELGVSNNLNEARQTGGDIEIPLATWASTAVGTEHFQGLADDVKFSKDDLTVRQAADRQNVIAGLMQSEAEKATKENPALQTGKDFVFNDVHQKLLDVGRPEKEAKAAAELWASRAVVEAGRRGITPEQWYGGTPIKVVTGEAAQSSPEELNQSPQAAALEQKAVERFGETNDLSKAGFVLADGRLVDFSGKNMGSEGDARLYDHRAVAEIYGPREYANDTERMRDFIGNTGAARIGNYSDVGGEHFTVETQGPLSQKQLKAIGDYLDTHQTSNAILEVVDAGGQSLRHETISKPTGEDVARFFNGSSLYQGEALPRGSVEFTPEKAVIKLFKEADASTFLHESAHVWLEDMFGFVKGEKATDQYKSDWKIISDWLGVGEGQVKLTREQHEKFAQGFESYLRDGKSPSEGLRATFSKFRRWLTKIYRDAAPLKNELSDQVRGVMDRMLASEDEISFAEREAGKDYGLDLSALDPEVREKLRDLSDQAHEQAVSELFRKQLDELTQQHQARLTQEATEARVKAEETVRNSPVQLAMEAIQKTFNKEPIKLAENFWGEKTNKETRQQFEQIAEARGFSCGDELAKKILAEPPVDKQVQAMVDHHMDQFADLRNTDKIKEEALAAVHNTKQTELMAYERNALQELVDKAMGRIVNRKQRAAEAKIEAETAKFKAAEIIGGKPVQEAGSFMPYFTAERNAAVNVAKALAAKDYSKAAEYKRQQMLNHALVREAYDARAEIQKTLRYFNRFSDRGIDLKNIPYGFVRQIDTLLSDRGLADPRSEDAKTYLAIAQDMAVKGADPDEIAHQTGYVQGPQGQWQQESLAETAARIQNDYRNVHIPASVFESPKSYRTMSLDQFRDLKTAVRSLNAVGRGYDNFLDENIKLDRKAAAAATRAFIEQNIGTKYLEARDIGTKKGTNKLTKGLDSILNLPDGAIPNLVNLLTACDFLDAGNPDGPMKNYVYRILKHGRDTEMRMSTQAVKDMNEIMSKHWGKGEFEELKKGSPIFIESRNREMTRDEMLSVALNWGNEVNRKRVTDGYGLNDVQIKEILSHVDKRQWDFCQDTWDYFNSYWPKIVDVQQKIAGETPEKVPSSVVKTPFGDYNGGYYPISYDYTRSNEAYANIEKRNALYKTAGSVAAHTNHGFTEQRVDNLVRPVRLDTNVIFTHLEDLMHDLAMRQSVVDVNGFLRQKDVREALTNAIGLKGYRAFGDHLKWVASDQGEYLTAADKILRRIRFGSTVATLGFRPITAPIFFSSNILNALQDIGPTRFGNSIKDFLSDRDTNVQFVNEKSARMTKRVTMRDRDLADMARRWKGDESLFQHYAFYLHNKADQAITYPLWLETYKATVGQFGEKKAVDLADEAVTKLAGSGDILDQAPIQRGSESHKIFTWWYSWAGNMFNRGWLAGRMGGLEYDRGNVGKALTITAEAALYGWVFQGANEVLWRELFRNNDNPDEDKKKTRIATRMLMQGISYVPIFRDIVGYGLDKALKGDAEIKLPFQNAVETAVNPLAEMAHAAIKDKELTPRFWEDVAHVGAITANYPQTLNTLVFNFIDDLNHNGDPGWRDLFSRKTKN